jgi:ABC-type antimicrobial peptide transport system permease subunit
MALGAAKTQILLSVARRGVILAGIGVALGLIGAVGAGRLLRSVLVGVRTIDPLVLAIVAVVAMAVAVAAIAAPSRRAMAVNPAEALRPR